MLAYEIHIGILHISLRVFLSRFEVKYKYKLWDKTVPDLPGLVIKTMKSVESMTVKPRRGDTYRKCNYGCEA
jgi:hypothetical protein